MCNALVSPTGLAPCLRAARRPDASSSLVQVCHNSRQKPPHRSPRRLNAAASAASLGTSTRQPDAAAPAAAQAAPSTSSLVYTSYESNSFYVQFPKSGVNVLVDPWLVGKLTFGGLDFIFAGSKRAVGPDRVDIDALAAATDIILLTQGIDDHAHRPTLQRLPKTIPVVASPAGAAVARSLGFRTVYSLRAGQSLGLLGGRLTVQGTEGALVGPPWSQRELGVILREGGLREGGASLYYEPHADCLPDSVQRAVAAGGPVDVAVLPPTSQLLLGYPLVKGHTDSLSLLRLLRPKVFVPLMNAEIDSTGPLAELLEEQGSAEELQRQLAASPETAATQVRLPQPLEPMPLEV